MADKQQKTVLEFIRETAVADPKTALDLALAETEKIKAQADYAAQNYKELSEVKIGPFGMEASNIGGIYRIARIFSGSDLVPDHFKGKVDNCFIAIQMAMRCKVDPFAFLQKCYLVHGRPGIESQLAIAMANTSGIFGRRISFTMIGDKGKDSWGCRASTTIKETGEEISETVDLKIAKDMGWWTKLDRNGKDISLWPKMTDLMLKYRSAMWLIRTNAPEILMGIYSVDELKDLVDEPTNGNGKPTMSAQAVLDELARVKSEASGKTTDMNTVPEETKPANGNGKAAAAETLVEFQPQELAEGEIPNEPSNVDDSPEGREKYRQAKIQAIKDRLAECWEPKHQLADFKIAVGDPAKNLKTIAQIERWSLADLEDAARKLEVHIAAQPDADEPAQGGAGA